MTDIVNIPEDCIAEGLRLGFPNVSSCTAVICIMDTTLIGAHFVTDMNGNQPETIRLCDRMKAEIRARRVYGLYILGWNSKHNPVAIKAAINCAPDVSLAYDISNYHYGIFNSKGGDGITYFIYTEFIAYNATPNIWLKRNSKVHSINDDASFRVNWITPRSGNKRGFNSEINPQHTHPIFRRHFVNL